MFIWSSGRQVLLARSKVGMKGVEGGNYFGEGFNRVCHMHTHFLPGLWPEPPTFSLFLVLFPFNPFPPLPEEYFQRYSCLVSLFVYLFIVNISHNYVTARGKTPCLLCSQLCILQGLAH